VCLPWQHWTEALVWFDDVDISAFHSCVVDLWQSLSEWHLLLSSCKRSEVEIRGRSSLFFDFTQLRLVVC